MKYNNQLLLDEHASRFLGHSIKFYLKNVKRKKEILFRKYLTLMFQVIICVKVKHHLHNLNKINTRFTHIDIQIPFNVQTPQSHIVKHRVFNKYKHCLTDYSSAFITHAMHT